MSDDLIRQAREMLAGTTEGPWESVYSIGVFTPNHPRENHGRIVMVRELIASCGRGRVPDSDSAANARFIAWCREGVPALIAELEERNG